MKVVGGYGNSGDAASMTSTSAAADAAVADVCRSGAALPVRVVVDGHGSGMKPSDDDEAAEAAATTT